MKKFIVAVGLLALVVGLLEMLSPHDFVVEREITIAQPVPVVFDYLKNLKNNQNWDPWTKLDPKMVREFRGTDGEVGSVASWSGNDDVGSGEQEIKNMVPNERIDMELRFKEPFEDTSSGYYVFEAHGENQTKVTWGMAGHNPFPLNIMCFVMNMKDMIGKDFENGLGHLKGLLEKL